MRIIIEHGTTKREIEGPFNVCGSRDELEHIAALITRELAAHPNMSFGWVSIMPPDAVQPSVANTPPEPWE